MGGAVKLEIVMKNSVKNSDDCIFLHLDKRCSYMAEDLDTLARRNFETKLFVMVKPCAGDATFLGHITRVI